VDFDPGSGTFNLTSAGEADIFISKLDSSGNFVWAKQLGGTSIDIGYSIAVDVSGNVYTTGFFYGTADFDPGPGTFNLTSAGYFNIFISKLDASGNFVWAKKLGGPSNNRGNSIAVDASGNVYTTGYFRGTVDFDPGSGTFNLTSAGNSDIFISKLDASGNFAWAKKLGGTSIDIGYSIAVDVSGNVYTTGSFEGTADFDPGSGTFNLTSAGSADIFVHKMSQSNTGLGEIFFEQTMSIFPNPVDDMLSVELIASQDGECLWKLYDMSGKLVMSGNYSLYPGLNTLSIETVQLTSGLYMLQSVINGSSNTTRFIKQ